MRTMIEAFTSIIFISVICVLLVGMIGSYMSVNNARNYHANIIDRLENSDYQDEYIEKIYDEAKKAGYRITIEDVSYKFNRFCYYVRLDYRTGIEVFDLINKMFKYEGVIEGYAT